MTIKKSSAQLSKKQLKTNTRRRSTSWTTFLIHNGLQNDLGNKRVTIEQLSAAAAKEQLEAETSNQHEKPDEIDELEKQPVSIITAELQANSLNQHSDWASFGGNTNIDEQRLAVEQQVCLDIEEFPVGKSPMCEHCQDDEEVGEGQYRSFTE